jgi:hypothetical protein
MAPSQTRLVVSGVTCEQVWKDRVKFWDGVYGEQCASSLTNLQDST